MTSFKETFQVLERQKEQALLHITTLGQFQLTRKGEVVKAKEWGRDKTLQLFQFFISNRNRSAIHKEQIIDRLWEDASDRDFKVALHGINKVLEPNRAARTEPIFIIKQGLSYQLSKEKIWLDIEALEKYAIIGNETYQSQAKTAIKAYKAAIELYQGVYLPNRVYEDWSSPERERLQLMILGIYVTLSDLLIESNPLESIRLAQQALSIDHCWEEAYRIQMRAYIAKGNRPQAIKTYKKCVSILNKEYGIEPLPDTKALMASIVSI